MEQNTFNKHKNVKQKLKDVLKGIDFRDTGNVDFNRFLTECNELKIFLNANDKDVLATLFKKNRYIRYENALKYLVPILSKNNDNLV